MPVLNPKHEKFAQHLAAGFDRNITNSPDISHHVSYRGYAKETFDRAFSATRKRHAHSLANAQSTSVQNEGRISVQNEAEEQKASAAK